jgi:crotonobetainyl-CoA:carnitine CoA-transferase CaiB-like acyl-CoA transferase
MVADTSAPMLLAYGIALALLERERTGRGQLVETSLMQAAVAIQSVDLVQLERDPGIPEPQASASTLYRCRDGRYINVLALTERHVVALFAALGLEALLAERVRDTSNLATVQREARADIAVAIGAWTAEECLELLRAAGVPCGPVLSRDEVFESEQVRASEAFVEQQHPEAGTVHIVGVPVQLSEQPGAVRVGAPALGEHTAEVLREHGYSDEEIEVLRSSGVLA